MAPSTSCTRLEWVQIPATACISPDDARQTTIGPSKPSIDRMAPGARSVTAQTSIHSPCSTDVAARVVDETDSGTTRSSSNVGSAA